MPKFSGIDASLIAAFSGKSFVEGGGGGVTLPSETDTGVIYFEAGGFNSSIIDADEIFSSASISLYKSQIFDRTDIVSIKTNPYHIFALSSTGVLYSAGSTNTTSMGRSTTGTGNETYNFVETLTSVDKFAPHANGCFAIKTDGTLWWCGSISNYAQASDISNQSVNYAYGSWLQFGTDTDWKGIFIFPSYPYAAFAVKGGIGSEYLYSCGYNQYGRTGLGLSSGITLGWTRVKSDASTDWTETIDWVHSSYYGVTIITKSGKLFCMGDGQYHGCGQGGTTDQLYPIQVGTDTDWVKSYDVGQAGAFAIKSTGEIYSSISNTGYYEIRPSIADRTFRQCGTGSDYEDIRVQDTINGSGAEVIFKKSTDGNWYFNANQTFYCLGGANPVTNGADNWITINEVLQGNDITRTGSIEDILISFKNNNQVQGEIITFVISGSA